MTTLTHISGPETVTRSSSAANPSTLLALSVVVPVFNEEESVLPIYERLRTVLAGGSDPYSSSYEIIFVDDGSTDDSFAVCAKIQASDPCVRVVQFRRNSGKTAALNAGFSIATGARVVTIDADMQEDPAAIFALFDKMDEGFDLVSAWRRERHDPISKTLPSRVFNTVVSRITGIHLHDFNCGFKAYSCEVIRDLKLYGELHRFIPVLASQRGFKIAEVPVEHSRRRFGKSKFGARRLGRGYLDFIQVLFLTTYLRQPLRLFGMLGTLLTLIGALICFYLSVLWLQGEAIGHRPLLTLGVLMVIAGFQFISTGLVGEMLRNSSFRRGDDYSVRRILGWEHSDNA
ncbi:glycosyltransferase family 2 protein [Chloroflexales bacterium ZM16-3]|nr:glycosyltransferase family 2 protein [Chloroflexales bacterium ZM16-3]